MGCTFTCNRKNLHDHLLCCTFSGISKEKDLEDRQLTKEAVIMECEEERIRRQMHLSIGSGYWSERSEVSERSLVRSLIVLCIMMIKIGHELLLLSILFHFHSLTNYFICDRFTHLDSCKYKNDYSIIEKLYRFNEIRSMKLAIVTLLILSHPETWTSTSTWVRTERRVDKK